MRWLIALGKFLLVLVASVLISGFWLALLCFISLYITLLFTERFDTGFGLMFVVTWKVLALVCLLICFWFAGSEANDQLKRYKPKNVAPLKVYEAAEERQTARTKRVDAEQLAKRQAEKRNSPGFSLGRFVERSAGIASAVGRVRARSQAPASFSAQNLVYTDAIWLVRQIALEHDEIREADAKALRLLSEGARAKDFVSSSSETVIAFVEQVGGTELMLLSLLIAENSPEVPQLVEGLTRFALSVGGTRLRSEGLRTAMQAIETRANGADGQTQPGDDSPWHALGLLPGASREEIKAAHRKKVRQWHPDQLEHMAPELRTFANQEPARINAAYEELTQRAH